MILAEVEMLDVFAALERDGVRYCVLRGHDALESREPFREIDLLVDRRDLGSFAACVSRLGFVTWPSWGHAPHSFYLTYDESRGGWIKLDVVTSLRYGRPVPALDVGWTSDCLVQRQRGEVALPAPEHEFLSLLLHALLDKGMLRPEHRERLTRLWGELASSGRRDRLASLLEAHLGSALPWGGLESALDHGRWDDLLEWRRDLERALQRRQRAAAAWRRIRGHLLRRLRPVLFALRRRGVSVALLAPDGAGKSLLAQGLAADRQLRARVIYMGRNARAVNVSLPGASWLRTRAGGSPFKGSHLLELWYRSRVGLLHQQLGHCVVYDRYVYDSLTTPGSSTLRQRVRRWLLLHTCPAPDVVLLLDAPGTTLYARKKEHSPEKLEKQRQSFLAARDRIPNLVVLDASRDPDDVRRQALGAIWTRQAAKLAGKEPDVGRR